MKVFYILYILAITLVSARIRYLEQNCDKVCVHKDCTGEANYCTVYYTRTRLGKGGTNGNPAYAFYSGCYMVPINTNVSDSYNNAQCYEY